jgi:hypothetical protein
MKTLVFEGAGWAEADTSKSTDVGNCRIRTRLRNNKGRVIYLEMSSGKVDNKNKLIQDDIKHLNYATYIKDLFYTDAKWDNNRNHSKALSPLTNVHFEYNKENLLKFVNDNLNCSFDNVVVYNNNEVLVHNSEEPLCDSSNGQYEPYKDIEINISELANVKPVYSRDGYNHAEYKINYNSLLEIPYMKKYFEDRSDREQQKLQNEELRAYFRWDKNGTITDLELHAGVCMGASAEDIQTIINLVKADNSNYNIDNTREMLYNVNIK